MKKTLMILMMIVICLSATLSVSAADMTHNVGQLYVPYTAASPAFDGNVTAEEWGNAVKFTVNDTNSKAFWQAGFAEVPTTYAIDVYFMWDAQFLYFAYDVTDPTGCYYDEWQFNGGDAIQLLVDLGPSLSGMALKDSQVLGSNRAPLFAAGPQVTPDGAVGAPLWLHQCVVNEAVITDYEYMPAAAGLTDHGWTFEGAIPWELLKSDVKDKSDIVIDKIGAGTELTALLVYNDYNTNRAIGNIFGTTYTGYETEFSFEPDEHGIFLTLLGEGEKAPETSETPATSEPITDTSDVTTEKPQDSGDESSDTKAPDTSDKNSETLPSETSGTVSEPDDSNNIGLYIGIGVAAIVIIAVVVILIVRKKKK